MHLPLFYVERQRRKGKIYPLNTEFHRKTRRDKKDFLSDQHKNIEKNNKMGKTRDLFKKTGDTRGTFHAKMGSIKDRNGMELEKQKILRRARIHRRTIQKRCSQPR